MSKRKVPYAHLLLFSEVLLDQLKRSPSDEAYAKNLEQVLAKKMEIKTKFTLKSYNKKDEMVLKRIRKKGKVDMEALETYLGELREFVLNLPTDIYKKWKNNCRKLSSNQGGKTIFIDDDTLKSISQLISKFPKDDSTDEIFEFVPKEAGRTEFKEALNKIFDQMNQNTTKIKQLQKKLKSYKKNRN